MNVREYVEMRAGDRELVAGKMLTEHQAQRRQEGAMTMLVDDLRRTVRCGRMGS